jgi:hypothetical protein
VGLVIVFLGYQQYCLKKMSLLRNIIIIVIMMVRAGSGAFAASPDTLNAASGSKTDEFHLLKSERIGDLRIDLSAREVNTKIPCTLKKGQEQIWEALGEYVQEWNYPDCGIILNMIAEEKGGPQKVYSITVTKPNNLKTKKGIHIGSSEQEVIKAYRQYQDTEMSQKGKMFVAGSVYGGLVFIFDNGRVIKIVLGPVAE